MICPTVQVKTPVTQDNPLGVVIINESDFVEGQHELFNQEGEKAADAGKKAPAAKKPSAEVPKAPPAPPAEEAPAKQAVTAPWKQT
jgi:hypothetical protein